MSCHPAGGMSKIDRVIIVNLSPLGNGFDPKKRQELE